MPINSVGGPGAANFGQFQDGTSNTVTVRLGETLSDVAHRAGCDKHALLQANPHIKDLYQKLNAGQELNLPGLTPTGGAAQAEAGKASGKRQHAPIVVVKEVDVSSS